MHDNGCSDGPLDVRPSEALSRDNDKCLQFSQEALRELKRERANKCECRVRVKSDGLRRGE